MHSKCYEKKCEYFCWWSCYIKGSVWEVFSKAYFSGIALIFEKNSLDTDVLSLLKYYDFPLLSFFHFNKR